MHVGVCARIFLPPPPISELRLLHHSDRIFPGSIQAVVKGAAKAESALLDEKFSKAADKLGLTEVLDAIKDTAHNHREQHAPNASGGMRRSVSESVVEGEETSGGDDGDGETFGFVGVAGSPNDAAGATTRLPPLKQESATSTLSTVSTSHGEISLNCAHTAFFRHSKSQLVSGAALVLLGHCINERYQEAVFVGGNATTTEHEPVARRSVDDAASTGGAGGPHPPAKPYFKSAPVKSFDRTEQKMMVDYANPIEFPEPDKANYPMDILRSSLVFKDAAAIQAFVDRMVKEPTAVHPAFVQVVRVKPTMQFLRQVILNVVISPQMHDKASGKMRKMLYADLQADSRRFATWKENFARLGGFHLEGAEALLSTPAIAQMEVRMVTASSKQPR